MLKIVNITKSYANNGVQNHVLSNLSTEIHDGDFTVIMGSSGSGKSTLLYCLSGMEEITSGEVYYNDKAVHKMSEKEVANYRRNDIGFVFQQMQLIENLTIFENIAIPGYLVEKNTKNVHEHANVLLKQFEIEKVAKHLPSQCSGGEQQRGGIARALINKPSVIFADEPTGALNSKMSINVLDALTSINDKGQSIVMVTHDVKAALRANRILYLQDGTILGDLKLPSYHDQDSKSRETQVISWLTSMGW